MPGLSLAAPAILSAPVAGVAALAILIGGTTDSSADSTTPGLTGGSICSTSGPLAGLSAVQAQNARVVAATASARAGNRAALIAVMTGLAESGLRILANPNDPSGNQLPNQGVGSDHDSLGIFQQRGPWGTAAQRMDPVASTNLFLNALLRQAGWSSVEPWRAAQDVQRSAFTGVPIAANGFSLASPPSSTVKIQRATQPVPWSTAVAAGEISDPGVTAREVSALVTLHTTEAGIDHEIVTSVAFTLNLEGPPALASWGFVGAVTYDAVHVSRS